MRCLKPVDTALRAFPTVNVVKSSGTVRIFGDFKHLNHYFIVDQHPIPLPSDLFSVLIGGKYITN